ncbi:hypothetical protein CKF54_02300 [Psittacicella hinzii]|uniref:PTS system glucose-specific EIIA component n=1 Tax=Psittacicella hinzii TaxID=2028575 RepID=A0A3A1YC83_9GAMM|nr:glucose PTS transporter subunit IIA [Psittacicella hinzii]RIY33727.1 hypothetical protein CKF54_02300 [Psittacicella hinzii]
MGLLKAIFDFFNKPNETTVTVYAPLSGEVLAIEDVSDIVFSDLILGDGIAIKPDLEQKYVVSPVDGTVVQLYQTQHAVMLSTPPGLNIFIHVGFNTFTLRGQCFNSLVALDQKVKLTEALLEVDFNLIAAKNLETVTPIVVSNLNDKFEIVEKLSAGARVEAGITPIYKIKFKR